MRIKLIKLTIRIIFNNNLSYLAGGAPSQMKLNKVRFKYKALQSCTGNNLTALHLKSDKKFTE